MTRLERHHTRKLRVQTAMRRILQTYERATVGERQAGIEWYQIASDLARQLTPGEVHRGAGVIAALSPRVTWNENQTGAIKIIAAADSGSRIPPSVAGTYRNKDKAWKIATRQYSDTPEEHLNEWPGYYKVNRFFRNISGDPFSVTVDVWAARVCLGPNAPATIKGLLYLDCERAYQTAAHHLGDITPRDLQAACWIHIRGRSN